jgi:hypothetical protein
MNMRIHLPASLPDSHEMPDLAREVKLFWRNRGPAPG